MLLLVRLNALLRGSIMTLRNSPVEADEDLPLLLEICVMRLVSYYYTDP
ncbi:hypothetical protein ANAPC1_00639 [Anaplasma phagocytophilum]|uniref:Uncharacterized protein n=2 Tax=Anaplasma phagocytophilum TaxID=948 RepID=A0AA45ZHH0_ANAPH|nr:hypothetical protein ANAPC1_00639 [Anaplasma phagocytophilum]